MKKQVLLPLLSILIIVGGLFGWSQGAGNSVLLGLDLKGGAEVFLNLLKIQNLGAMHSMMLLTNQLR